MNTAFSRLKFSKPLMGLIVLVVLLSFSAAAYFILRDAQVLPVKESSVIGDKGHPITDVSILKQVLSQISGVRSLPKPAWVHFRYQGYQTPPEIPHPLQSKDGFRTIDTWYFINKAGFIEKSETIIADLQGNVLQHSACAEDICGNISKLALPEFDDEPITSPYQPVPYNPNPASSWIQEVDSPDTLAYGWLEQHEDETIFYISSERKPRNEAVSRNAPEYEGSIIHKGISKDRGILTHFSMHDIIDGKEVVRYLDDLVFYETMGSNPEKDAEIADIIAALKMRDGK